MILVSFLLAVATGEDAAARLHEAERLAASREHGPAAAIYRDLLRDGHDDPYVHYNLGTLALLTGDAGTAVLELLAARRLAPLDDDVAHNWDLALRSRVDQIANTAPMGFARAGAALPPGATRVAFGVAGVLLGGWLLLRELLPARLRSARTASIMTTTLLAFVTLIGAGMLARLSFEGVQFVVIQQETSARQSAGDRANVRFVAHPGLLGTLIDEQGSSVRVRLENGLDVWFERADVGFVPARPAGT